MRLYRMEKERAVALLRDEGYSVSQIAEELGSSQRSVSRFLHRVQ